MQPVDSFIRKTTKFICTKSNNIGAAEHCWPSYRSITLRYITLHYVSYPSLLHPQFTISIFNRSFRTSVLPLHYNTLHYISLLHPQFTTSIFNRSFRTSDNADGNTAILNTTNKLHSLNCPHNSVVHKNSCSQLMTFVSFSTQKTIIPCPYCPT